MIYMLFGEQDGKPNYTIGYGYNEVQYDTRQTSLQ